ncbi:MAG: NapC/NirT family cytochrome c [Rhodospirillaceae bacterium]
MSPRDVIIGADRQARIDAAQTDSRECRNCHSFTAIDVAQQEKRAPESHLRAIDRGMTCIDCH